MNASNWKAFIGDYDSTSFRQRKHNALVSAYLRVFGFIGCLTS